MKKIIFSLCLSSVIYAGYSQDTTATKAADPALEVAGVKITGSLDVYYRYNVANNSDLTNNKTSFTNSQNSFELGMASVQVAHSFGKASAFIDLGFGKRAEEFSYADAGHSTLSSIKQAYLSYQVSDKFKLTMGKWATHIGYELADAYLNRNYSMSYMFSYGPFSHTGLKADIGLGDKSALMVGVANTTDVVSTNISPKFIIAQYSTATKDDKFKAYLNFQAGNTHLLNLIQGDVVLTYAFTDKFSMGYNGTLQSRKQRALQTEDYSAANSWWGSALYFNLDPAPAFGLTLRGEYLGDDKESGVGINTNVYEVTLSPNIKVGNLTIIPELRYDGAKDEVFYKHDGTATKSTFTALLAAAYHF